MPQSFSVNPVVEPAAVSPTTDKVRLKRRKHFNPLFKDGHIHREGYLRTDLYALVKPPEDTPLAVEAPAVRPAVPGIASSRLKTTARVTSVARNQVTLPDGGPGPLSAHGAHAVWWETAYPTILNLSRSEYDLFIQTVRPDVDPTTLHRYRVPKACKKGEVGPQWRDLPERIPSVVPTAREAQIPWEVSRLMGALLHLAGIYEREELSIVRLSASYREAAEVIGIKHNNLIPLVREKGVSSQAVVPVHVAYPGEGAGARGKNKDGSRRHAPAHPANEYLLYICEAALVWARKFRDQYGTPAKPIPYESVELPATIDPVDQEEAKRKWAQLHQDIRNSGMRPERIKALLGLISRIKPLAWDRQTNTLTLEGIITPAAVQVIESRSDCRVRFLLTAGTYIT